MNGEVTAMGWAVLTKVERKTLDYLSSPESVCSVGGESARDSKKSVAVQGMNVRSNI